jgi:hypothetical protein
MSSRNYTSIRLAAGVFWAYFLCYPKFICGIGGKLEV